MVHTGIDIETTKGFPLTEGAGVGVVCNQATQNSRGQHLVDLLCEQGNCDLKRIFAPEHGFRGTAQDMEAVEDERHDNFEVVSLYGQDESSLKPSPKLLEDLDILLVDLPDIGCRYYTYAQSLAYCMEVAGTTGTKVVVLDRPNPIGGTQIEGSSLKRDCRSFCGIGPIANRHGMTLGELAKLFQCGFGTGEDAIEPIKCDLEVVGVSNWQRSMYLDETVLPWIRPSPNMPSLDAAIVYPGTCLFEATNFSEGRGTDKAFLHIGAPFANGRDWLSALSEFKPFFDGVTLRPTSFTPKYQKHAGQECHGIHISIEDRSRLQSYRMGIALLISAARAFPNAFQWRNDPYEFIKDVPAIDLLYGSSILRDVAENRESIDTLIRELDKFETWFEDARSPHLIY